MPSRVWKYQASINGVAIFMISEGCKRTTPRSSQRCAPLDVSPNNSTPTSSSTPARYSGTANDSRRCTGTAATTHITPSAIIICTRSVGRRSGEALLINTHA